MVMVPRPPGYVGPVFVYAKIDNELCMACVLEYSIYTMHYTGIYARPEQQIAKLPEHI